MAKSYSEIAIWARGCALRAQSGYSFAENLEASESFSKRKKALAVDAVKRGEPLSESLSAFYPDLSSADIDFLKAASKSGNLGEGFDLLSNQYFQRASVLDSFLSAFIYPLGVFVIGIFLISVQAVLYEESVLRTEALVFSIRVVGLLFFLYLAKKVLRARPPVLFALCRRIPHLRKFSNLLAAQRYIWVLEKGSLSAMSVDDTFRSAADSSGKPRHIRKTAVLLKRLSEGAEFTASFRDLALALPKAARRSIRATSPNDLPSWAAIAMRQIEDDCSGASSLSRKLFKVLALLLMSPPIFLVIRFLFQVMTEELGQRWNQFF